MEAMQTCTGDIILESIITVIFDEEKYKIMRVSKHL
jgi:hypothetical protein